MNSLIVRRKTDNDIEQIGLLLNELGYQISCEKLAKQLHHYRAPESIVLVAECQESNNIAGLTSGHVIPLLHQSGFLGRVTAMIVSADSQGNGIGSKLLNELETWFSDNQLSLIHI